MAKETIEMMNCENCGALVTTEICPSCGSFTRVNVASVDLDYPVIDCKEAHIEFGSVGYVGVMGLIAFVFGVMALVGAFAGKVWEFILIGLWFVAGGLGIICVFIKKAINCHKVKKYGTEYIGTVHGYLGDRVKILLDTPAGPKFILYQTKQNYAMYGINTQISVLVYDGYYLIGKNKNIDWR